MKNILISILILTTFLNAAFAQLLKIPQLTPILNSGLASEDVTIISDISAGASKKLSIGELDLRWQWTATSPLVKSAGASAVLSIPAASASVNGFLLNTDWTIFNNKVSLTGTETLTNKTLTGNTAVNLISGAATVTLPTTTGTLATLANAEVLTNKDIDGGTASNTSRVTLPKAAKTSLDALTRKQGTIVFDTTSNKPYYDDGALLKAVGSGSGGGKNFIEGGDAESGTTGFATYADAAGTRPVDGTAGSPVVTWTTTTTASLENLNSFLYTKDAANRQGNGVSYAFTIDTMDRAKVLNISFQYLVSSGTFVAGTSTTDSDVIVYIYDVTNAVLIEPSSFKLLSNSTTITDKFSATFQTASNSSSYRLIFHTASTSASAYTLKIDDIKTERSNYTYGTPITDWQSYTPTFTGFGTVATQSFVWRKLGSDIEVRGRFTAGTPTAVTAEVSLPSVTVATTYTTNRNSGAYYRSASTPTHGGPTLSSSGDTTIKFSSPTVYSNTASNSLAVDLGSNLLGVGEEMSLSYTAPILGWGSSVQTADQTDTRIVDFTGYIAAAQAVTASTTDVPFTSDKDTHGGWNGSQYTVRVPGDYTFTANLYATATAVQSVVYKNGAAFAYLAYSPINQVGGGYVLVPNLKTGDTLSVRTAATQTIAADTALRIGISKISGPSTMAANDLIVASAFKSTNQSISNATPVVVTGYDAAAINTNGNFNSTTGVFTVESAGVYEVTANAHIAFNATGYRFNQINKNGAVYQYGTFVNANSGDGTHVIATALIRCIAGDTISQSVYQSSGGALDIRALAGATSMHIQRIGK